MLRRLKTFGVTAGVTPSREQLVECVMALRSEGQHDPDDVLLELDSLGLVELVASIEDRFGFHMPDTQLSDAMFTSVNALWRSVQELASTGHRTTPS